MIVWPKNGWGKIDSSALAADLVDLGCVGVIPQCSDEAPTWLAQHKAPLEASGLQLSSGLGRVTARAILASLKEFIPVVLDEEDWHKVQDADNLAQQVEAGIPELPNFRQYITDCMYPSVVSTKGGTHTGHDKITKAFNALCGGMRFPQCYDEVPLIPDGWVAKDLEWAQDPSQWPSIGVPAELVGATVQMYHRSVTDHVTFFLSQNGRPVILWDYCEEDSSARLGLLVTKAIESRGFKTVSEFQQSVGLTTDGVVGPKTCQALGVSIPTGSVIWHS